LKFLTVWESFEQFQINYVPGVYTEENELPRFNISDINEPTYFESSP